MTPVIHQDDEIEVVGKKATIQEKAEAMFYLGLIYEYGFGVEKSAKRAFNYFLQSSDLDYPAAKNKSVSAPGPGSRNSSRSTGAAGGDLKTI